jgi:hypothetical protein
MIYQDYQTPKLYRNINAYIGAVTKKETKYGIMQTSSYNRLSDEESIRITIDTLEKSLKDIKTKTVDKLDILLSMYNNEEKSQIINIYNEINEFLKK